MSKAKKVILISVILLVSCTIVSVCSVLLYSNFAADPQDKTVAGLFGDENVDEVKNGNYKCTWKAFDKEGNETVLFENNVNYNWE